MKYIKLSEVDFYNAHDRLREEGHYLIRVVEVTIPRKGRFFEVWYL